MSSESDARIVVERVYRAKLEELWSLWTTKEGFASWWGPQGFRVDVHRFEARIGGEVNYDMVADSPEMIAAMERSGQPTSHETRGAFTQLKPFERLAITHVIEFLPGIEPYNSTIEVDFVPVPDGSVRMIVSLSQMHDADTTRMQ